MAAERQRFSVTLRYQRRQMTLDFWQGVGIEREPDALGVLSCLLSDAYAADQLFEEFCAEFGYDDDSRRAERTWRQCVAQTKKLRRLLGDNFDRFLGAENDA